MQKITAILNEIRLEYDKGIILQKIPLLIGEIESLLSHINDAKTIESANEYFELLEQIQTVLATLLFKERLPLPDNLKKFVRDFDRVDVPVVRKYLFEKIKQGEYFLYDSQ